MDIKLVNCPNCKNTLSNARLNVFCCNDSKGEFSPVIKLIITLGYMSSAYTTVTNTRQIVRELRILVDDNYESFKKVLLSKIGKEYDRYQSAFLDLCIYCSSIVRITSPPEIPFSKEEVRTVNRNIFQKYFKVPFDLYYEQDHNNKEPIEALYCIKNNLFQKDWYNRLDFDSFELSHLYLKDLYEEFWSIDLKKFTTEELLAFNSYATIRK